MSPSMVYLKNQDEVSLAFGEVSYAISIVVQQFGVTKFVSFLRSLEALPFQAGFKKSFGLTPVQLQEKIKTSIIAEKWEKTKGAMGDEVRFSSVDESDYIGADAQGKTHLGDRMRMMNRFDAALVEYEEALKLEPDNGVILLKAAKMNLALKDNQKALENLKRAASMNPNYGTPQVLLASFLPAEEALPYLETANAINPFDPAIHKLWSEYLLKLGKASDAEEEGKIFELLGGSVP